MSTRSVFTLKYISIGEFDQHEKSQNDMAVQITFALPYHLSMKPLNIGLKYD